MKKLLLSILFISLPNKPFWLDSIRDFFGPIVLTVFDGNLHYNQALFEKLKTQRLEAQRLAEAAEAPRLEAPRLEDLEKHFLKKINRITIYTPKNVENANPNVIMTPREEEEASARNTLCKALDLSMGNIGYASLDVSSKIDALNNFMQQPNYQQIFNQSLDVVVLKLMQNDPATLQAQKEDDEFKKAIEESLNEQEKLKFENDQRELVLKQVLEQSKREAIESGILVLKRKLSADQISTNSSRKKTKIADDDEKQSSSSDPSFDPSLSNDSPLFFDPKTLEPSTSTSLSPETGPDTSFNKTLQDAREAREAQKKKSEIIS